MTDPRPLDSGTSMRPAPHVYAREFGGDLVLLHFGRGEYFGLDAIGTEVWRKCIAGATLGEAATHIAETFEVSYEQALADVLHLASELRLADLVTI